MRDKVKYVHFIFRGFLWPGNHEPILGYTNIPEVDIGIGGLVYVIQERPFIGYLKRGKVYTIVSLSHIEKA